MSIIHEILTSYSYVDTELLKNPETITDSLNSLNLKGD